MASKPVKREHYNISDEERQRRSDNAKALVAKGVIGGAGRGQGRKRKPRVDELLAEAAHDNAHKIEKVYKDGINPKQPIHIRLKAAGEWVSIAQQQAKLQLQESEFDEKIKNANEEQLIAIILQELEKPGAKEAFNGYFDVEGSAIELGQGQLEEDSENAT